MRGHRIAEASPSAAFDALSQPAAANIGANKQLQATHCRSALGGELQFGGRPECWRWRRIEEEIASAVIDVRFGCIRVHWCEVRVHPR